MYSIKTDSKETKKAKGIKKRVIKNNIKHNDYENALKNKAVTNVIMNVIRSKAHIVTSDKIKKIGLSCFDDKRFILDNGIDKLPYGFECDWTETML